MATPFTITWTFPVDADAIDVRDTLCTRWGYDANKDGTKMEFITKKVKLWTRQEYIQAKRDTAAQAVVDAGTAATNVNFG